MISGMLSPSSLCQQDFSHLKMESACFECSFGRSLAPDADSDCSSLPGDLILPISHDEKHILLQAVLLTGGCASGTGGGCYSSQASAKMWKWALDHLWRRTGITARGHQPQPGQGLGISKVLLSSPGLAPSEVGGCPVSQRQQGTCGGARRLTNPSGFTFVTCLLY